MGLSEWEKKDAAMWDGFRNGNSNFSPSVADNNNSTTKITTVTEDANGNKQTVVNENKTAADLMKQKQQEAYDREEPARQAHAQKVAQRDFDSEMLFDSSIKGTPAWMEYGDTPFGPQAQIPAQYANIDLPNKDVVNAEGLSRGNIFARINDGIMSGNLDKAEGERMKMEALADGREEYNAMVSDQTSEFDNEPWGGTSGVAKPGPRSFFDILTLDDEIKRGKNRFRQAEEEDRIDAINEDTQLKNKDMMSAFDTAIAAGVDVKKPELGKLLDKENRNTLFGLQNATPSEEKNYRKIADADRKIIATKKAINAGLEVSSTAVADAEDEANSLRILAGELPSKVDTTVTTEVEAKAVIDSPENIAAKAQLDNWLNAIKDPAVTKEQAQDSAEAMINNAVAAAPKNDGSKLKKALILAAGSMLFGSSFTEALNAGFGVVGKEVEKEQKLAAELAKEQREVGKALKIHAGKKAIDGVGGVEFDKNATQVNIGTDSKPIMASKVVDPSGNINYVSAGINGGRAFGVAELDQLAKLNPGKISSVHKPWKTKSERNAETRKNMESLQSLLKSNFSKYTNDNASDEEKAMFNPALVSTLQVGDAMQVMKENGYNTDFGYDLEMENIMNRAALKGVNSKYPNKTLAMRVQDELTYIDFMSAEIPGSKESLPSTAYQVSAYDYDTGSYVGKDLKEPGVEPKDAWEKTKRGVSRYFKRLAGSDTASKTSFNSQVGQTYQMFKQWELKNGLNKDTQERNGRAKANFTVALAEGYTPFMWWVTKDQKITKEK